MFEGRDSFGFPEKEQILIGGEGSSASSALSPAHFPNTGGLNITGQQVVGQAMVRTGVAILMVPDPLPLIDEVVAGAMVVGGSIMTLTS